MCVEDGFVAFQNGELLCGNLGKKTLGGESKRGLFYVLIRDFGALQATTCMRRLSKLCARYLGDRGFSISIDDVTPSLILQKLKSEIITQGQKDVNEQIQLYKSGKIKLKPGCDALQSLESEVNGILGRIRERCGKEAMGALHHTNAPRTMAQCGSKGSPLNVSQMIACLGQQSVGGTRIQDGFVNRTLPHFPVGSLFPSAKGFVSNSFFSGLTATEFFFHTMGGREGLVDTAVKTAETGYMARRLMKALEDLSLQYDGTVRNSEQTIVQFCYGDDGLNPQVMEGGDRPVDYTRLFVNIIKNKNNNNKSMITNQSELELSLSSIEIKNLVEEQLMKDSFQSLLPRGQLFLDETKKFFYDYASKLEKLEMLNAENRYILSANYGVDYIQSLDKLPAETIRMKLLSFSSSNLYQWIEASRRKGTVESYEAYRLLQDNILRITHSQVMMILSSALKKYHLSMVEPGEAVGAVGAQSISEPGTLTHTTYCMF